MEPTADLESTVAATLRKSDSRFAFVFGSRAGGTERPDSDLDVAAWWGQDPPDRWDVGLPAGVDLTVLDTAPLWLAGRVALEGRVLFDDDPPRRVAWQADTRFIYLDEIPHLRRRQREWLEAESPMVDAERVLRLLDRVRRDRDVLGRFVGSSLTETDLDAIKYRFITAIEGAARVAHHLSVSEGWSTPETNADAFAELARNDVIDTAVAERLGAASGFRNILVHRYADVDDDRVVENLDRLGDLDEFVIQVGRWVADQ